MKKTLREQIYENMDLKETDELLDIWHEHDTHEWREETFEIIKSILLKRLGEIPPISRKRPDKELLEKIEGYIEKVKLRKALRECNLALERFPDSADLYNLRGLTHDLWDDTENAQKNYQKALELDPQHEGAKENLTALKKELGESKKDALIKVEHPTPRENKDAFQDAEFVTFYSPELAQKHYRRGLQYDKKDAEENALKSYRKALQFNPGLNAAYENLSILEEALEDDFYEKDFFEKLDLALEFFYENQRERALTICDDLKVNLPPIASAHNELGMVFEELGELDEAQTCYQQATRFNPRFVEAFINLRNINERLEARLYEQSPVDEEIFIEFDNNGEWNGLVEPLPGWVYNNANAYFLRGTPGHRTLPGKSGLDPMDTYSEQARVEGIIIHSLLAFRFRTHNPFYLFSMAFMGVFMSTPLVFGFIVFFQGNPFFLTTMLSTIVYWMTGPLLLVNVFLSLATKRPTDREDNGNPFF